MYYNCLSGISQAQMMTYQACGLFMAIIVLAVNLPAIQIEYVFFVIFVCFAVLVGTVCTLDRPQAAVTGVLFWFLCTMGTVVNVHTRTMVQFFLTEKEKQQTENFTRELKHTIANVAHDLKTPLSSFTNGMDLMEMLWHDMQACLPVANSVITGEDMQKIEEQLIKHSRSLQKLEALKFIRPGFDESARSNLLDSARSQSEPSSREIVTTDRILETKGMESRPLEVLIVDDAPTIIKITSIMLRRTGCRVSTAENGQDAIDALVQRHIQLQERSELLQKLRSNGDQEQTGFAHPTYTADRFVIAAAGAVDHKQLVDLTNKHFGDLETGIRYDSMKEAHIALAFEGASWTSEYSFPLMLMQTILGSWDRTSAAGRNAGSKLAVDVAENDLAHSFMTFNTCYKDTGLFGIYLTAPDNKLDDAMWYTLSNLVRLTHNVTEDEVQRAKTQLKANMLIQLDSFSNIAEDIGRQMLTYGRRISNAELFARIDALTVDDVKKTANKFINDEDHALAAIGPIYELPDYNWIRRRSYWHRY
eukprot:gene7449-8236_t